MDDEDLLDDGMDALKGIRGTDNGDAADDQGAQDQGGDQGQQDDGALFEYTGEDGQVQKFTGDQIMEFMSKAQTLEAQNRELQDKVKIFDTVKPYLPGQQTQGQQPRQQAQQQIDWQPLAQRYQEFEDSGDKVGMLQFLYEMATHTAQQQFDQQYESRQQAEGTIGKFKSEYNDFDQAMQDGRLQKFMTDNPHYSGNPVEAHVVMKHREVLAENANLKAQIEAAKVQGKKEGQQETIKTLRSRGTLRALNGNGGVNGAQSRGQKQVPQFTNTDDLAAGMLQGLRELRGRG